jgi:isoquinoline 1-oxidoreductase alpha subunit
MIKFYVNGDTIEFLADPETPLLWALRDTLGLTGTKFGCGRAQCGACTVHVNGEAAFSCQVKVGELQGKRVNTIEGLPPGSAVVKAVKRAWIDKDVVQCGYCQPGQVMAAVALLNRKKSPTDAEIDAAMDGNLCRCGTYQRVREAIRAASAELSGKR